MLTEQPNKSHTDTADLFRVVDLPPISNEAKAAIANITAPSSKSALMQFVNRELSADDMRSIARHALRAASEDEPDAHYRAALSYIANISQTADDMRATAHNALNRVIIRSKTRQTDSAWDIIKSSNKVPLMISNRGELSFGDGVTASEAATALLENYNEQFNAMKKENERLKALLAEQPPAPPTKEYPMLTEQMKKDLANPADVIDIITGGMAKIRAQKIGDTYFLATSYQDKDNPTHFEPTCYYFYAQDLRETAAVFNALADTLDKQNGGVNG